MHTFTQDLVFGFRLLKKSPVFTVTAVLLLGLGIGASTAVFTLLDAVLLKPLPYPEPQKIVMPWNIPPANLNIAGYFPWSPIQFHAMEQETRTFQSLGAFQSDTFNLSGAGEPALLEGMRVSYGFFPSLGVTPALGRLFTREEDQPGHDHEVLLSDALWRDRFGSSPEVIGRVIDLNGAPFTVIAVMPPGFSFPHANEMPESFSFPREAQLWVPAALPAVPGPNASAELAVVGRLQDGISVAQAQSAMDVFATRMDNLIPAAKGWFKSRVVPLQLQVAGDTRRPLVLMLSAVVGVLLIVCFNLAGLMLMRSIQREREMGIRTALGAGRYRILRQLLVESLLLSTVGGAVGLAVCFACISLARRFGPASIPRLQETGFDFRTFSFAIAVTLLTTLIIGIAPAFGAMRTNLIESLKAGGQKAGAGPTHPLLRSALVVFQIGLSLVLVVICGLLVQTFRNLLGVNGGFQPEHVLTFELSLPPATYPEKTNIVSFYRQALPRLREIAGVQSAAIADVVPMGGAPESTAILIGVRVPASRNDIPMVNYAVVSPNFFAALGTPLQRGRDFLDSDDESAQPVAIINQSMARRFWPDQDPIGKQLRVPVQKQSMTIVGVVADLKHTSMREVPAPEVFVPYTQEVWPSLAMMRVVLRSRTDPDAVIGGARSVVQSLDSRLPLAKIATLVSLRDSALSRERFSILLLGFFAVFSLLLAAVGIYGVISYSVGHRAQEIGIRMALGATRGSVFSSILSRGFQLTAIGIVLGVCAALVASRAVTTYLYGVKSYDPLTFLAVCVVIAMVAMLAGLFPAYRAASIEPVRALRNE